MSNFVENVVQSADDFIWNVIVDNLPRYSKANTGFLNFNCPMCGDYKPRCGVRRGTYIGINCYNCSFTTRYLPGRPISHKLCDFLGRLGVSDRDIGRLKHRALVVARMLESVETLPESVQAVMFEPAFAAVSLPKDAAPLTWWADQGCTDEDFLTVTEYGLSRGKHIVSTANFHWSPSEKYSKRLIMPFYFHGKVVGYTARTAVNDGDKYLNTMPPNYLFNSDVLEGDGEYVFIVEGPTCALAIGGISPLGAKLNAIQARWIKSSGKTPVVIADRDTPGVKLIEVAQANKWAVSFPCLGGHHNDWWDADIKDCDEAVKRHGQIYVMRSILESITTNPAEIEVKKRRYLGGN